MPQTPPNQPPSHQVEKIREIIVGRQLRSVEQRLARLEENLRPMPVEPQREAPGNSDAQQQQAAEIREIKHRLTSTTESHAEETKRLALQIQSVARGRKEMAEEVRRTVEAELRPWFMEWQGQLQQHLQKRESHLIAEFRAELENMRHWVRREMAQQPQGDNENLRRALEAFATSARTLADQFSPGKS